MTNCSRLRAGWLLALCITASGSAFAIQNDSFAQSPIDADPSALEAQWPTDEAALRAMRGELPAHFAEAYALHPQIPEGLLEAIAYSQSRWMPLVPDAQADAHLHMPGAYGVMGLYGGDGFTDQLGEAASLTGLSVAQIARDSRSNILAAAALLAREISAEGFAKGVAPEPEALVGVLARYAGFAPVQDKASAVEDFARQSFAYDVLLTLDRGAHDLGVQVPERAIAWEKAFPMDMLVKMRAPFVRLDLTRDKIDTDDFAIDPISETLVQKGAKSAAKSTDYGPAIWNAAYSGNYTASRSQAISAVTIHTTQGSYAGTISWFTNASANVSAHYVIRSSDGQVTQMVRDAHTAWHVGSQNGYTLGIEHEGYVSSSSWYTTAMYNASAALVRHMCSKYGISCASAYRGAASSGINVLSTSVKIKGHQHYAGQSHTDPGIHWNWSRYYDLLNPAPPPSSTVSYLDRFESSVGHFAHSPSYSGSTTGISTASTALRDCSMQKNGNCSLQVKLVDNASSSAAWDVRLLSGGGSPSANVSLTRSNGKVGFWVYSGGSGLSAALGIDDSDGTERSIARTIPANQWAYLEWNLADAAQWNAWVGGNGAISASKVTLDAIWIQRAQTSYTVYVYLDDVQIKN